MNSQVEIAAHDAVGPLSWPAQPKVKLGLSGAEPALTETEQAFQDMAHAFARDVMRPVGQKLDRLTPEEIIDPNSIYFTEFRPKYLALDINPVTLSELSPEELGKVLPIIMEEFGWGDGGLSVTIGACQLPPLIALMFGKAHLLERYPVDMIGCWAITEPDHGSDALDPSKQIFHAQGKYGRPNCVAKIEGDKVVINGQKSAWVSNGPIAEVCVLYAAADTGVGADPEKGVVMLVPMNAPGISRGKSIDKLGQRPLPQGEIFFDNVTLPLENILAGPEEFQRAVYAIHCEANGQMGAIWTGAARAAFEIAWQYAHERKQGGVPIYRHQSVAQRLFHMYRKVEASRALVRRVAAFNFTSPLPALQAAMATKITATQTSFEVASDALQMLGGNGNTREYPIEKILRDARASMIEDGCNEILSIKGGYQMMDPDLL
ncbi:acyl-CoA dehydrogenase family protein [Novosphingobium album (ex Hu et al. 2023)]|uniref:Acyl-CoA dehydrogenase family protein n=1 Tax=Novosphingobium album (ex Hu et al. 2023) TaxID=2930093 RepID=A0ABT0AZ67_9SPHN|nr:acyl-CoA dehydrogenase family protein [Novosphingobium album (ex Hu et al. 2023)]MCJ2178082.1 acyl-CoA dehydrogenase family protein [Novosphingobium album (ex Hu et al. 2023)]